MNFVVFLNQYVEVLPDVQYCRFLLKVIKMQSHIILLSLVSLPWSLNYSYGYAMFGDEIGMCVLMKWNNIEILKWSGVIGVIIVYWMQLFLVPQFDMAKLEGEESVWKKERKAWYIQCPFRVLFQFPKERYKWTFLELYSHKKNHT